MLNLASIRLVFLILKAMKIVTNLIRLLDKVDWRVPVPVLLCRVSAVLQKQLHDFVFALGGALVQRGEPPQVARVDGSPMFDQKFGDFEVTVSVKNLVS